MAVVSTDRRFGVNSGAAFKVPVLAATTANITLSGTQTIDGVACITGDRVLVQNQTSSIDNGIYDVDTGAWTRSADFDGSYDVVYGTLIPINQGTVYAQRIRRVTTTGTITPGTTGLSFDDALYANATGIQFTQSGNGAVATTAAGEFGTWVKPQQFGAVGDGVHDDTAALALWIAAGATRALYLPSGTWTTTAEIAYNAATSGPLMIAGAGPNAILKATGTTNKVLHISGTAGVTTNPVSLRNFAIQSGTSGTSAAGLHLDGIAHWFVSDVWVDGKSKMTNGFQMTAAQQGQVSGGSALGCVNGALVEQASNVSSNGIDWHGMTFVNSAINLYIYNNGTGVSPGGCDDIFFHGNHLTSAPMGIDAYGTGLGMLSFTDNAIEPVTSNYKSVIVRNGQAYIAGNTIAGVSVDLDLNNSQFFVIGNLINGTTNVQASCQNCVLAANNFGSTVTDSGTNTRYFANHNNTGTWPLDYFGASTIQGIDVQAANNMTLPIGTYFRVSGTTQINLLDSSNAKGGQIRILRFGGSLTVKHNQAASGTFKPIILNGAVDFVTQALNTLTVVWDSGDVQWYEVARKV